MRHLLAFALAMTPAPLAAQDVELALHQRLVVLFEPMGTEHALAMGVRVPIGDPRELLFTGTHIEVGVANYTSPIYTMNGAYVQVSPLAFLVLRAELLGAAVWPIGMPGAGYYPVEGYGAALGETNLRAEDGRAATGWNATLSAILQGAFPVGPLRLIVWNQLALEHVSLGDAAFHFYPRHDVILAESDWVLDEHALVLVEGELEPGLLLRAGAYDAMRYAPRSDYLANQAGLIAALVIERADPAVAEIMPFARAGLYTNGTRAGGATVLLGVTVRYAAARWRE